MRERAGSSPVIRTIKELNEPLGFVFLYTTVTDLRQCRLHCRQTLFATCPAMQLTASEDRRKRKAFADIERSGHSKQIYTQCPCKARLCDKHKFVLRRPQAKIDASAKHLRTSSAADIANKYNTQCPCKARLCDKHNLFCVDAPL